MCALTSLDVSDRHFTFLTVTDCTCQSLDVLRDRLQSYLINTTCALTSLDVSDRYFTFLTVTERTCQSLNA